MSVASNDLRLILSRTIAVCVCLLFLVSPVLVNSQETQEEKQTDPLTDPLAETQTTGPPKGPPKGPPVDQPMQQQRGTQRTQNQKPAAPVAKQPKVEIPAPEEMLLDTSDGVSLRCSFLGAPKTEGVDAKNVVPFILIHDWDGTRNDLAKFAFYLQSIGHAVILPDLRGHGDSVRVAGVDEPIDATKFRKAEAMSAQKDIETCKKFLVKRHNQGELNIDLLCVVAVGQSSVLAVQWTLNDWVAYPAYNAKGTKQGQDVKALLLISPIKKLKGVSMAQNLKHTLFSGSGGQALPLMIMWGESEETSRETEGIYNALKKSRPDLSSVTDNEQKKALETLFSVHVEKYKFTGKEMIQSAQVPNLWPYMVKTLIEEKVVVNAEKHPWVTREEEKEEAEK